MRYAVSFLILTFSLNAFAVPKTVEEFLKESQNLRKELAKEKDHTKKIKKLTDLEKAINSTLTEYRKKNPTEGTDAEDQVNLFLLNLTPVSTILSKKPTPADCKKAKHRVRFEERGAAPDDTPLTSGAQEATAWIDLLCN